MCNRFLLKETKFVFVVTRKFSRDPIEALFGFLRRTAGCNDAMDMSMICGIEKMMKMGIVSASMQSMCQYFNIILCFLSCFQPCHTETQ